MESPLNTSCSSGGGRLRTPTSPQHRLDASDEFARAERFRDVVVRADREADELVDLLGPRRQHDDVDVRLGSQLPQHLQAIETRHRHIEQDQIGMMFPDDAERLVSVGGLHDLEAFRFEVSAQDVTDMGLVVGHDDARPRGCVHAPRR